MKLKTIFLIQNNPYYQRFLQEESYHYQMLYRDDSYIQVLDRLVKEKYQLRFTDQLDRMEQNIKMLSTFMNLFDENMIQ